MNEYRIVYEQMAERLARDTVLCEYATSGRACTPSPIPSTAMAKSLLTNIILTLIHLNRTFHIIIH